MARRRTAILACLSCLATGAGAARADWIDAARLSGSFLGQARFPASHQVDEERDLLTEAVVVQGIEMPTGIAHVDAHSYAKLGISADAEKLGYNNFVRGSVGGELQWRPAAGTLIASGAAYEIERRWLSGDTFEGPAAYLRWTAYESSELVGEAISGHPLNLTAFSWGEFRYPARQDPQQSHTGILEGRAELGVDWYQPAPRLRANSFIELGYKFDTAGLAYNNDLEPAVGVKLKLDIAENATIELGLKYLHEYRFITNTHAHGVTAFLNWFVPY